MRRLAAALVLLVACSNGSEPDNNLQVAGTWSGNYTNSASPTPFQAVMELQQEGTEVTGTIATTANRTGVVDGQVDEDALTAVITYTDGCTGSAETTAVVEGSNLVGQYTSTDCVGETVGSYTLSRR